MSIIGKNFIDIYFFADIIKKTDNKTAEETMNLYFAPLEGITTYIYRNTHAEMFGGCGAYYSPFINPSDQYKVSRKGEKDILPEFNSGIDLKIQVLTNRAESFLRFSEKMQRLGYDEININLGCPSATVVKKGRGSGFLQDKQALDAFLYEIFSKSDMKISLKTRIGFDSPDEMEELLQIYNKYPLSLLIIHPRTRADFYDGVPRDEIFAACYKNSKNKLCYNGNIYTVEDYKRVAERFEDIDGVMFGRGAIRNPAIFREIKGGKKITTAELIEFSKRLMENYYAVLKSDTFTLHKLKEIWVYILQNYPDEKKIAKAMKKSTTLADFKAAMSCLPELQ